MIDLSRLPSELVVNIVNFLPNTTMVRKLSQNWNKLFLKNVRKINLTIFLKSSTSTKELKNLPKWCKQTNKCQIKMTDIFIPGIYHILRFIHQSETIRTMIINISPTFYSWKTSDRVDLSIPDNIKKLIMKGDFIMDTINLSGCKNLTELDASHMSIMMPFFKSGGKIKRMKCRTLQHTIMKCIDLRNVEFLEVTDLDLDLDYVNLRQFRKLKEIKCSSFRSPTDGSMKLPYSLEKLTIVHENNTFDHNILPPKLKKLEICGRDRSRILKECEEVRFVENELSKIFKMCEKIKYFTLKGSTMYRFSTMSKITNKRIFIDVESCFCLKKICPIDIQNYTHNVNISNEMKTIDYRNLQTIKTKIYKIENFDGQIYKMFRSTAQKFIHSSLHFDHSNFFCSSRYVREYYGMKIILNPTIIDKCDKTFFEWEDTPHNRCTCPECRKTGQNINIFETMKEYMDKPETDWICSDDEIVKIKSKNNNGCVLS